MGVCFGKVITANSPKSLIGFQQNWQSLLWHEYCHVITLQKTNNRMPRWLSEGISFTRSASGTVRGASRCRRSTVTLSSAAR